MVNDLISRTALHKRLFPYGMPDDGNYGINAKAVENAIQEALGAYEWVSTSDRLPPQSGNYLVCGMSEITGSYSWMMMTHYSAKHKAFNAWDDNYTPNYEIYPDFWAVLPPIPTMEAE